MGADMKGLKTRLRSVESTMHLTRAMGLVASSKMRRSGESMQKSRAYADAFGDVMNLLSRCPACEKSPYMQTKETGTPVLIVIAGDRGLAGGYNANVFRLTYAIGEMEAKQVSSQEIALLDESGETAFTVCAPYMEDAAMACSQDLSLEIQSVENGGRWRCC